ncbi:hypothetical protein P3X46_011419 [Hevea brasiliensis]|uniref:Chromatin assembly factor 1 subunit FAS1 n=1 Tax=Hevea brasiliensis TaxID=3981 RepID=A0ABQ9M730_HEVBR|nr:hypothetical protein P3X46_011419 [Hevea brasiliensis]
MNIISCATNLGSSPDSKKWRRKQLLQFDKSHRPAFYGIWPRKSIVIGPRHPFGKDPDLDYDIDSDEEWEEEDPGESLSDCDKDDEEQSLEEGCSKDDDEDGFFVPDGYLSENEGVQLDKTDLFVEEARGSHSCKQDSENEKFCTLLQQQKYLNNLTETALRKNQPLIILNLMHEKVPLLVAEDLNGLNKLEKTCLDALSMRTFPGGPTMGISVVNMQAEDQDVRGSIGKATSTHISTVITIQESDMTIVVSAIQSCSQSINKVVESLQQKFPAFSKSQLRNKVHEISAFVDNSWQGREGEGCKRFPHFSQRGACLHLVRVRCSRPKKSDSAVEGQQAFTCIALTCRPNPS